MMGSGGSMMAGRGVSNSRMGGGMAGMGGGMGGMMGEMPAGATGPPAAQAGAKTRRLYNVPDSSRSPVALRLEAQVQAQERDAKRIGKPVDSSRLGDRLAEGLSSTNELKQKAEEAKLGRLNKEAEAKPGQESRTDVKYDHASIVDREAAKKPGQPQTPQEQAGAERSAARFGEPTQNFAMNPASGQPQQQSGQNLSSTITQGLGLADQTPASTPAQRRLLRRSLPPLHSSRNRRRMRRRLTAISIIPSSPSRPSRSRRSRSTSTRPATPTSAASSTRTRCRPRTRSGSRRCSTTSPTTTRRRPRASDPFAVHVEVAGCPWNAEHRLARIGLDGQADRPATSGRPATSSS